MRLTIQANTKFLGWLVSLQLLALIAGCTPSTDKVQVASSSSQDTIESQTQQWAEHFFGLYAKRNDWESFLDCYSEDVKFEDQRVGSKLSGRKALSEFYNWKDPRFQRINDDDLNLEVAELVIQSRTAVARGTFAPFHWDGQTMNWPDDFVIWLRFNADGKIIFQRDFTPYPKSLLPDEN